MRVKWGFIVTLIVIGTMFVGSLGYAKLVYAQTCGGDCSVTECNCGYQHVGGKDVWICDWCSNCGGNGCQSVTCPSGTYMSNNGCVAIGSGGCECGVNASGGCKSCSTGPDCFSGGVNCQAGGTISLGQPVDTWMQFILHLS